MRSLLKEFKSFAMKGNLIELAVAFILGVAFATLVQSFVADVVMPLVAAIVGEPNFDKLTFTLGDSKVTYGTFLTALVNFLLIAFVLFLIVKAANKAMRPKGAPAEPPTTRECPYCKTVVPITATRCSVCTSDIEPVTP